MEVCKVWDIFHAHQIMDFLFEKIKSLLYLKKLRSLLQNQ